MKSHFSGLVLGHPFLWRRNHPNPFIGFWDKGFFRFKPLASILDSGGHLGTWNHTFLDRSQGTLSYDVGIIQTRSLVVEIETFSDLKLWRPYWIVAAILEHWITLFWIGLRTPILMTPESSKSVHWLLRYWFLMPSPMMESATSCVTHISLLYIRLGDSPS